MEFLNNMFYSGGELLSDLVKQDISVNINNFFCDLQSLSDFYQL